MTKKNHARAMEQIQFSIEDESKAKAECLRMKKKLEQDLGELESSLKRSNLENSELQVHMRRHQESMKCKSAEIESVRRDADLVRDYVIVAERKVCTLKNSVEENRSMLDHSDKLRRQIEQELSEVNEEQSKMEFKNSTAEQEKRRIDSDLVDLQVELDEVKSELNDRESKAKSNMIEAAKIAEELHMEQQLTEGLVNEIKILETKVKDMSAKIDEAENTCMKNGKKQVSKHEDRIRELVRQIDDEERRKADALKNLRKAERGIKEYVYRSEEDQKNSERIKVSRDIKKTFRKLLSL